LASVKEVLVPDIGGATDVDVIELFVSSGDHVKIEDSLITLEGEKATMEIPSPYDGKVVELKVAIGDKVAEGSLILTMEVEKAEKEPKVALEKATKKPEKPSAPPPPKGPEVAKRAVEKPLLGAAVHAGPSVRRLAREFGVDLTQVRGSGRKARIIKEDVQSFVKERLAQGEGVTAGLAISPAPAIDFSRFGEIESKPLNKIKRATGAHVHRSWMTIPHVTQFGEADITDMESYRQKHKSDAKKQGVRLTPLVFIMKAVIASLKAYPQFNASLDPSGVELIYKKYFHLGIAVDTPNGLVVPVFRDVDKKDVIQIAKELGDVSTKAREKGLTPAEMAGSCFTISSLGGIGGTAFTPIINAPDVAILGVSRSYMKPVFEDGNFTPRLTLPLSLSYDHRVIDGADAARFIVQLTNSLADETTWS